MMIFAVLFAYCAIGTTVSAEQLCYLVSFTHYGRMTWALKSENILECTHIAIGGHSSLELLPQKLILFENPNILLTAGENLQAILNEKRLYTFFNSKSDKRHSLSIEKGPFECSQEYVSSVTAFNSTTNLSVEGTTAITSHSDSRQSGTSEAVSLSGTIQNAATSTGTTATTSHSDSGQPGTSEAVSLSGTIQDAATSTGTTATTSHSDSGQPGTSEAVSLSGTIQDAAASTGTTAITSHSDSGQPGTSEAVSLSRTIQNAATSTGTTAITSDSDSRQPGSSEIVSVAGTIQNTATSIDEGAMPCNTNEETSGCCCESRDFEWASVSDVNLRHCYCATSSGGMFAWFPQDCYELYNKGIIQSGVYTIQTTYTSQLRFSVYCNMTIDEGGWTVFQRRRDGSVDFNQNWTAYEDGFGNLMGDFWLGNEKLCHLTQTRRYKLRIDRFHATHHDLYSVYDNFVVRCANENYTLASLGPHKGSSGITLDGLSDYSGKTFKTSDQHADCKCGWWCCGDCKTNLNGQYNDGIKWDGIANYKFIEMKMKPFIST